MLLVVLAAGWLVIAGVLAVLAAIKLHAPGLLAQHAWLTYGRVQPAAWNAFVFGFASPAGLALALWMIARLSGAPLRGGGFIILGALVWNAGLKVGLFGIFLGDTTGFEGMELPRYAAPLLLAGYLLMAPWALLTFERRAEPVAYVTQWFLVAALLVFPWVYAAGYLATSFIPLRGVLQAAAQAWYLQNLHVLWMGYLGLATLFYLIPKITGAAVPSRSLALFGFWTLTALGGLTALGRQAGGPFPAWMTSVAVVAGVFLIFPVGALGWSLAATVRGAGARVRSSVVLWFALAALGAFVLTGLLGAVNAPMSVRRLTQFTLFPMGLDQLWIQGVCGLALLGGLYFLIPRLLEETWPWPALARAHFFLAAGGLGLLTVAFLVGGLVQGAALNDPETGFIVVVRRYLPFASTATLAHLLNLTGACLFGINLVGALGICWRRVAQPAVRSWWTAPAKAEAGT